MKKLKLEALEVTSFATTSDAGRARGTVEGHARDTGGFVPLQTYDPVACGDTQFMDCTYGCSIDTCANTCLFVVTEMKDCAQTV